MNDHEGSTALVTDAAGSQVSYTRYYPYGRTRTQAGTPPTDKLYTGQQRETMGGVYHYKARMYNADTGRFPQADTVVPDAGDPQALNRYAYAYNNPAVYTDPTGHFTFDGSFPMQQIPVPDVVKSVINWEGVRSWTWERGTWAFHFASGRLSFLSYVIEGRGISLPQESYNATIGVILKVREASASLELAVDLNGAKQLQLLAYADLLDGRDTGGVLQLNYCPGSVGFGCLTPVADWHYGATLTAPFVAPTRVRIELYPLLRDTAPGLRFSSTEIILNLRTGRSGQNTCLPFVGCF
jgi:RHS repeat-associated protein